MKKILNYSKRTFIGLLLLHLITTFVWVIIYDSKYNFENGMILFSMIIGDIIAYTLHYLFFIKTEYDISKENKEEYLKGILFNNIIITICIQLLLIVLTNYEIMLLPKDISRRIGPLGIICTSVFIKIFTSIIYYLLTNIKKSKQNKFMLIPFGIQASVFMILIIVNKIYGDDVLITLAIQGIVLIIGNYIVLKNRKKLSKKYNISEDKLCKKFYLILLLSFILLFGITLLLMEMDLILPCSGMFCGLGTAIIIVLLPVLEIVVSLICIIIAKIFK